MATTTPPAGAATDGGAIAVGEAVGTVVGDGGEKVVGAAVGPGLGAIVGDNVEAAVGPEDDSSVGDDVGVGVGGKVDPGSSAADDAGTGDVGAAAGAVIGDVAVLGVGAIATSVGAVVNAVGIHGVGEDAVAEVVGGTVGASSVGKVSSKSAVSDEAGTCSDIELGLEDEAGTGAARVGADDVDVVSGEFDDVSSGTGADVGSKVGDGVNTVASWYTEVGARGGACVVA